MPSIDLKSEVRRIVQADWPTFARAHPRLAEVLDQELLVESITAELAGDPEFQQALDSARAVSLAADTIGAFVRQSLRALGR